MKKLAERSLTAKEQRDLDIEIGFMEGLVTKDPASVEAWTTLVDDYPRRGKLPEGLRATIELAKLCPGDPGILYNLACGHALAKELEKSLAALRLAIENGFKDFTLMFKDPDLSNLRRKRSLFKKIRLEVSTAEKN